MAETEFKAITTQEELNAVIKDRLARERGKYADYDEIKAKVVDYETRLGTALAENENVAAKVAELEQTIRDRENTIQQMATESLRNRISAEYGLPAEMASRLNGSNEDELKADAEMLAGIIGQRSVVQMQAPLRNVESIPEEDGVMSAFLRMNPNIKIK